MMLCIRLLRFALPAMQARRGGRGGGQVAVTVLVKQIYLENLRGTTLLQIYINGQFTTA